MKTTFGHSLNCTNQGIQTI